MSLTRARAARLGLSIPLTAIIVAVLGLWPENDDDTLPQYSQPSGGGGATVAARSRPKFDQAEYERLNAEHDEEVRQRQNKWKVALAVAIAEALA